ncbi:dockerin type I domain-containing protein [Ruminococcus flavefaciens]|uniref:Dockerin domain-containing protein n=1 Tax=Ruminococcus flavefaciens TaxID=1265 RepID=A0A1M7LH02_RUMFL|nr:dockerin type I domain-containing protein [Ruminococcus flavefaciens]SHM77218.1 hypothetical protein SAMN04487860_11360 [Ruminococcus flavefaciens]
MKALTKIIAAALTASLAVCSVAPVNAAFTNIPSDTVVTAGDTVKIPTYTSEAEMLKYIRSQMRQRTESFSVAIKGISVNDSKEYTDMLIKKIFEYTGNPKEGSYLFLSIHKILLSTNVEDDILSIDFELSYMTTLDQEEKLDTQINTLIKGMNVILGDNYKEKPDAENIAKGYAYFVQFMKYADLTEDKTDTSLFSAYSVLTNKKANSIGFLQLFIRVLAEIGIESNAFFTSVDLTGKLGSHIIASVCVDGTYYLCDPVSDFLLEDGKNKFLLKGMNDFDSDFDGSSAYKQAAEKMNMTISEMAAQNGVALYSYDKKFEFGDVSDDGLIDSVDASMMLAEYARLSTSDKCGIFSAGQKTAADMDKNGRIDSVDASVILSYYAYKSTKSDSTSLSDFVSKKK